MLLSLSRSPLPCDDVLGPCGLQQQPMQHRPPMHSTTHLRPITAIITHLCIDGGTLACHHPQGIPAFWQAPDTAWRYAPDPRATPRACIPAARIRRFTSHPAARHDAAGAIGAVVADLDRLCVRLILPHTAPRGCDPACRCSQTQMRACTNVHSSFHALAPGAAAWWTMRRSVRPMHASLNFRAGFVCAHLSQLLPLATAQKLPGHACAFLMASAANFAHQL